MENPVCPKCKGVGTRRLKREGMLQIRFYTFLKLYPWECAQCRTTFRSRSRGHLRKRRHAEPLAQ